jgi:hypothetical protein
VDGGCGKVQDPQGIDLVFHQGDEGGDDQAGPGQDQGRELVADRFARPGGHHRQNVLAGEDRLHDLLLAGPELMKPEDPSHQLTGLQKLTVYIRLNGFQD